MFGFVIGFVCLFAAWRIHRRRRRFAFGHGWGPGSWGTPFGHGGFGRRSLDAWLARLGATDAQARVVEDAVARFRDEVRPLRGELRASRKDLARALRAPSVDATLLGEIFARHDTALETARKAFVGAAARVHETLDERQREILADAVERGPRGFLGGGFGAPEPPAPGGPPWAGAALYPWVPDPRWSPVSSSPREPFVL